MSAAPVPLALSLLALGCSPAGNAGTPSAGSGGRPEAVAGSAADGGTGVIKMPVAGTSGSAGTGGSGGVGAAPVMVDAGSSVLERNGNPARTGQFVVPSLSQAAVSKFFFDRSFSAAFEGEVWASPLYFEKGPSGRGAVLVVTTGNDVHALDSMSGGMLWSRNLGSPWPGAAPACGAVRPLGSVGTPIIDAVTRTLYVAAAVSAASEQRHEIHALSLDDGLERPGFPLDAHALMPDFDAALHYQESALSLLGGVLYVAYGARPCGDARGTVLAIDTQSLALLGAWTSRAPGGAVDAPGGLASDGDGVLVATGADNTPVALHQDSQQLMRLRRGTASSDAHELFYPATWHEMDANGSALGASNPMILELQGATPERYVAQLSGDGHLYLLDEQKLGGMAGQVIDFEVASGAAAIRTAPTTYRTSQGTYIALTAASGVTCPSGSPAPPVGNTGQVVASVRIKPGAPPEAEVAWCYYLIAGQGAPVSTSSDGSADGVVWVMDDVKLVGLDADTGHAIFDGGHDISGVPFAERTCPGVAPMTSAIAVGDRMMIAAKGRLCAWAEQ